VGIIRRSVENPVAANLLMILILVGGMISAFLIPRELFPEFSVDHISVSVPYPGAAPAEVEKGICLKIEDKLTGLEGIEEITCESREGSGVVLLKLRVGADPQEVLDEVKSEVEKIDFPEEAEDPTSVELTIRHHVIHVAVAGHAGEATLKEIAEEIRDEINDLPEVSQVSVSAVRRAEITVEASEEALRRYNLTLGRIAQAIRESSFDLPAGTVKTRAAELTVRIVGELSTAEEYKTIPVLSRPDGTVVRLGEIATVREGFEDVDVGGQFNGDPAALVSVFKTPKEDTVRITGAVRRYVQQKRRQMPEGITLQTWADQSKLIQDRLRMLIRNGIMGLCLVVLVLWLFLGIRLAIWVAMGIPVSIMGAMLVLNVTGATLNMMSMFALIMALGLIVDDAIVVGENVYRQVENGAHPRDAAVKGTLSVLLPVTGAVVTTWLAFVPLLFVPGVMGRFIAILPVTVIVALGFSLIECLLILPPHLAHSLQHRALARRRGGALRGAAQGARTRIDAALERFLRRVFTPVFRGAARYRYFTVACALGVAAVVAGGYFGGRLKVVAFPKVDSDTLRAKLVLPTGTPIDRTEAASRQITAAALRLNEQFAPQRKASRGRPVVERVYALLGQTSGFGGDVGSHVAEVIVELLPSEDRGVRSDALTSKWRQNVGAIPGAISLTFGAFRGGPRATPIEVRLLGASTDRIKPAAERLKDKLAGYPGVKDIEDDALPGKMEMRIRLKRGGLALGINQLRLARQVRNAFYGDEGLKIQRGRDEVKVRVRYPDSRRRSLGDIERMRIRTDSGAEVPFAEVADVRMERGYTVLRRIGGKSVITVGADVDEDVVNAEEILTDLEGSGFLGSLTAATPGLRVDLRGQRQQIFESLGALFVWFPLALLGIYTVLAALFKSYVQPLIIMVAIPFGLVGAVVGHWLTGFDLTLLSMFGMVALAGIVVNDSLVLLDLVNRKVRDGVAVLRAVEEGARQRFRPILLTTVTTVLGITPLMLERSFQAQFIKPMAISIAFGLSFATLLTLIVVPCLYLIGNDVRRAFRWLRTGQLVSAEDVARSPHE
jgi:multidrug efflux pump subunit AcrB